MLSIKINALKGNKFDATMVLCSLPLASSQYSGLNFETTQRVWKEGGTLLKKLKSKKKTKNKKITAIIASYPLPNVYYITYVK